MDNRKKWGLSFLIMVVSPILLMMLGATIHTSILFHRYREFYVGAGMPMPMEVRRLVTGLIITIVIVLAVSAFCIVSWIYKGFVSPIKKLREATKQIRSGNLDFELKVEGKDEIGELCEDFELMRRQLKETAEAKIIHDKESSMLISNICHDLKTPITSIQGYVEGLLDGVANTPEKQEKYIRTIYNKANDLNHLINELTIYSKLDTNRVPYNFQKLRMAAFFEDYVEETRLDMEGKNIEFHYFNYVEEACSIVIDPEQISRAMDNIIGNAVKYMDKPARVINLRVKDVGDFVQVEIEDNGKGIQQKDLPHIFERFYKGKNSSDKSFGVGLALARGIINRQNGTVKAENKKEGGAKFIMRFYKELS